jgi:transcriptional regulator with XRE-family HTH domain
MDVKKQVGSRIKFLRRTREYSQERLAEITGANSKYLSGIERSKENPTLKFLIRLSNGLGVGTEEMFRIQYENEGSASPVTRVRREY